MTNFEVGQKVAERNNRGVGYISEIVEINKTSIKTKNGRRYNLRGDLWGTAQERWNGSWLIECTPAVEKEVKQQRAKFRARRALDDIIQAIAGRDYHPYIEQLDTDLHNIIKKMEKAKNA